MITSTTNKTFSIKLFHNLCQAIPKGAAWHPPFYRGFSGNHLKWIAIVTMLCDHIAASVIFAYQLVHHGLTHTQLLWYELLRDIGRIAFPIFIFLMIEGLKHTKNATKYFFRLCVFALISEIPFDLALHRVWYYPAKQNVFWTLAIGFFVIWGMDSMMRQLRRMRRRLKAGRGPGSGDPGDPDPEHAVKDGGGTAGSRSAGIGSPVFSYLYLILLDAGLISAGAIGAIVLNTDYSYIGVLAIVAAYILRKYPIPQIAAMTLLLRIQSEREWYAMLAAIPILYYNGQRGRQNRYFFYVFYPVHLLVLYLIVRVMGWT